MSDLVEELVLPEIPDVAAIPAAERLPAADGIYGTAVLAPTRILATFYWARYRFFGKPLVLCDYDVVPLTSTSWIDVAARLNALCTERRSRAPVPLGLFVESDAIALQAREKAGIDAKSIPPWITEDANWQTMCQSAAAILSSGEVGFTQTAKEKMEVRPFMNEAGVMAGLPGNDSSIQSSLAPGAIATVASFIYGVILGLDPVAARDPKPRAAKPARRN